MKGQVWANFFSEGFFGYGAKGDFTYWSLAHFIPIILLAVGIFLVFHFREKIKAWKHEEKFRYILAVIMIVCEMSGWMKHKLESRLLGEISIISDTQMTPLLWQKVKKNQRAS